MVKNNSATKCTHLHIHIQIYTNTQKFKQMLHETLPHLIFKKSADGDHITDFITYISGPGFISSSLLL